jgi:ADP-ribose pyrophosphatase YjhB (NUDIX family)
MEPTPSPRHSVSVAGVILDRDASQVLLIQRRDNGRWEPPGGVLELSESIEAGLRREVREETGVEIEVEGLSGVYKNMAGGIIALVFRCRATTQPLTETNEAVAVAWQPVREVGALMPPAYAVRISDALALGRVPARAHDGIQLITGLG